MAAKSPLSLVSSTSDGLAALLIPQNTGRQATHDPKRCSNPSTSARSVANPPLNRYFCAKTLLLEITKYEKGVREKHIEILRGIASSKGAAGHLGRAILVTNLEHILSVDLKCIEMLAEHVQMRTDEARALRSVMLSYSSITPELTVILGDAIVKGAIESKDDRTDVAMSVAANILRPALADVRGDNSQGWGLSGSDVSVVLRQASPSIRLASLSVMLEWLPNEGSGPEVAWKQIYGPFFRDVWPKEREYRHASLTGEMIGIVVAARDAFSAALRQLSPYMIPLTQEPSGLYYIMESDTVEKFPEDTLSLLWHAYGHSGRGHFVGIAEILDRLVKARPEIEVDRRLQWLELHRAERNG